MKQFGSEDKDKKASLSSSSSDDYDDEDDFITFQFESKSINLYYSQFSKYSKLIRNKYVVSDVRKRFPQDLCDFQKKFDIDTATIYYFFQLLQKDFNIVESLSYKQYIDLSKLSEFLEIKKLTKKLNKYFKIHQIDIDFITQIILHEIKTQKDPENPDFHIDQQMEEILSKNINESLQNEGFIQLPIHIIYRIVKRSDKKHLSSDFLYIFIMKSISQFHPLFAFLDLKSLSEHNLYDLHEKYSQMTEYSQIYFSYLECNLPFIIELNEDKKNLQKKLKISDDKDDQLQKKLSILEQEKKQLQDRCNDLEKEKNDFEKQVIHLKSENDDMQKKLANSEEEIKKKNSFEEEKKQYEKRINEIESKICKITGSIEAKVTNEMYISADIKLIENGSSLDKTKSKYILSSVNDEVIGMNAYSGGEPLTSLNQKTIRFACKPGTYYMRALAVDSFGRFTELVSNPAESTTKCMIFEYEGKPREVVLPCGRYMLEVWGAQGGDSTGTGSRDRKAGGKGGLGGYSKGTLTLSKETKIFIYVGSRGKSATQSDGSETQGGFPDGGGTKTGLFEKYTTVPGTGGGSTSIRLSSDSLYSRVIVAGGGGGAGGDAHKTDHGGFGGGLSGGNSYAIGKLRDQGAGTQTGSTPGPEGSGPPGVAGTFGQGATGLYMQGRCSGGGGGGGWYGGGSGGYGDSTNCASGGGGSGWIFTETSYSNWKSGDQSNATKMNLDASFYLSDATTFSGDSSFPSPSGNGNETGHKGDGYAKITPL